ncbi:alpha-aminoadipic semialdehyde synthase [Coprinopsis cinerea okayama7|uniref:Alpha-aminoadipic semialdehyde synthase n=1 Tax=Coprinopsis cinerea (strain Okayama-7 / 130 / ATCC MYA-4618 / FGSC 9003) TaxID=240176 RepID=D6RR09_COPC7|nr:alpha-aminoadipic semialdehyde synthase [Coprinopsis cinerea okayama7\|eukprot:XP_002910086.1 alpha-aminoadipic semialdehyde synthase [Coprinopsis cinerea okayama7\
MLARNLSKPGRNLVVCIRREDPKRIWERRAPLTPDDVAALLAKHPNLSIEIQPCNKRVFPIEDYLHAGATLASRAPDIFLGIKETPVPELTWGPQTHLMFSHTHKGQPYNAPLLARFLEQYSKPKHASTPAPRLIDYELLTDPSTGKRTVGFGWFAGVAGVLESLSAMAHHHLEHGVASPFLYTPRPHTVPSLDEARKQLRNIGGLIREYGVPEALGPFIIGLTGRGNVSQGCLSMLEELPLEHIRVKDLDALVKDPNASRHKVYLVHVQPEEYLIDVNGGSYNRDSYYANPESYKSVFHERVAPYLTLLLNGTGWSPSYPRILPTDTLPSVLSHAYSIGGLRATNIGDISCDIEGGIEFMERATTISDPCFKVRVPTAKFAGDRSSTGSPSTTTAVSHKGEIQIMSVDILPASIPLDASKHFSSVLRPYIEAIVEDHSSTNPIFSLDSPVLGSAYSRALDSPPSKRQHPEDTHTTLLNALHRATIAHSGRLARPHKHLKDVVRAHCGPLPFREGRLSLESLLAPNGVATKQSKPERDADGNVLPPYLQPSAEEYNPGVYNIVEKEAKDVEIQVPPSPPSSSSHTTASSSRTTRSSSSSSSLRHSYSPSHTSSASAQARYKHTPRHSAAPTKRILMLGSGMVAGPAVDTIMDTPGMELVVASNSLHELQTLTAPHSVSGRVKYRVVDISKRETYKHLVAESDVVVSLLPAPMHPQIAKTCIEYGKHLVTASYISPEMAALDEAAKSSSTLLLNEIGLDPGIDHCSALDLLCRLKATNQHVVSFTSFCGGLPAYEDSRVPLRYKFSWRPQGVLTAAGNDAKYLVNGQTREIPGSSLLSSKFPKVPVPGFPHILEGLPNRDSLKYASIYGLPTDGSLKTLIRGTLRYPGFSDLMASFRSLGLLNTSTKVLPDTWRSFLRLAMAAQHSPGSSNGDHPLTTAAIEGKGKRPLPSLQSRIPANQIAEVWDALSWFGLIEGAGAGAGGSSVVSSGSSNSTNSPYVHAPPAMPPLPAEPTTPLDLFAYLLSSKLAYRLGERDMVVLSHEIITVDGHPSPPSSPSTTSPYPSTSDHHAQDQIQTRHTSTLVTYGTSTHSAMARTVGIPIGIAAIHVAQDHIPLRGVHGPTHPTVYRPVLDGLVRVGLGMQESSIRGIGMHESTLRGLGVAGHRPLVDREFERGLGEFF